MVDSDADKWDEVTQEHSGITTAELDAYAKVVKEAWDKHDAHKLETSKLYKEAERLEGKLIEALELAGKKKYIVEGIGTYYFIDKLVVTTPKTIEDTRALFTYIRQKHGDDFFFATASVNHQTLQKLYNTDFEEAVEKNPEDAATFAIPGLQPPTNKRSLGFRKEKA